MKSVSVILWKIFRNRILQHVLFWIFSYYLLLRIFADPGEFPPVDLIYTGLFHFTLFVGVYPNLEILIPRYLQKERYWQYFLLLGITLLAAVYFNIFFFEKLVDLILPGYYFISYYEFIDILQFFLAYIVITSLIKLSRSWFTVLEKEKEIARISEEKKIAELKALKAQVNPHFLFNSLNNIYGHALKSDSRTPDLILRLSDVLRYMIYETNKEQVLLESEIQCVLNYLELEKIRSSDLEVDIEVLGAGPEHRIAPLLLIPFVENAFKHGKQKGGFIKIAISVDSNRLKMEVTNGTDPKKSGQETRGIGIENTKRRLQLQYPDRHQLDIFTKGSVYTVNLILEL